MCQSNPLEIIGIFPPLDILQSSCIQVAEFCCPSPEKYLILCDERAPAVISYQYQASPCLQNICVVSDAPFWQKNALSTNNQHHSILCDEMGSGSLNSFCNQANITSLHLILDRSKSFLQLHLSSLSRCDGKSRCVVEVNSSNFHDACPGTLKYLEIHYACTSKIPQSGTSGSAGKQPSLPPWLIDRKNGKTGNSDSRKPKNSDGDKLQRGAKNRAGIKKLDSGVSRNSGKVATTTTASTLMVRKPILVTDRPGSNSGNDQRVPITTPSTTSRTTTTTTTVTTSVTSTILPTKPPRVEVTTTTLRRKIVTTPKPTAGVVGFDGKNANCKPIANFGGLKTLPSFKYLDTL